MDDKMWSQALFHMYSFVTSRCDTAGYDVLAGVCTVNEGVRTIGNAEVEVRAWRGFSISSINPTQNPPKVIYPPPTHTHTTQQQAAATTTDRCPNKPDTVQAVFLHMHAKVFKGQARPQEGTVVGGNACVKLLLRVLRVGTIPVEKLSGAVLASK